MANWFVAYKIEPSSWFNDIKSKIPDGIKIFLPSDLHMTIAFLGSVKEDTIKKILPVLQKHSIISYNISEPFFKVLPSEKHFTAFCLGFKNFPENLLSESTYLRDNILASAGLPAEKRTFLPHITLGRPPRNLDFNKRKSIVSDIKNLKLRDFTLNLAGISVYTWSDNRNDSLFKNVYDFF